MTPPPRRIPVRRSHAAATAAAATLLASLAVVSGVEAAELPTDGGASRTSAAAVAPGAPGPATPTRRPAAQPPPPPPPPPPPRVEHVIVISEDGLRPDAISRKLTPHHIAFMRAGARARIATTVHESDTLPSHAAMLSGFATKDHGLEWNSYKPDLGYIHVPTIFSIAKQHGLTTAMFVGKPKLRHIALPGSVDHLERPSYLCGGVSRRAAAWFEEQKPTLMFVHFSDPDEFGHSRGWMSGAYLKGVASSDHCLGTLMAGVERSGLLDKTLIIVTADHGGHEKIHSGSRGGKVDREIPWLVRGPGVAPDSEIRVPVDTVDTAATVLDALRLPRPPHMAGSPRLN